MNAEEILARTFADHESLAPDVEATLAGIHDRLPHRRRSITVLAAAAVVVLIVASFSVLAGWQRPDPGPPASPATLTAAPEAEEMVSLDTTWLPSGTARSTRVQRYYGTQEHTYIVTGADRVPITVDLVLRPGSDLTPAGSGPPPVELGYRQRDLRITGRPAREWENDTGHQDTSYTAVVRLTDKQVTDVGVSVPLGKEGRGAALAVIGRRVAASLRLDRPQPIDPAYRPGYVPTGFRVSAVGRVDVLGTFWALTTPGAVPDGAAVTIQDVPRGGASPASSGGAPPASAVAGQPVQGRPSKVVTDGATVTLWIEGLRPGLTIVISSTHAAVPLAELYKIADGIRS